MSFIKENMRGINVVGHISFSHAIMEADMKGSSPYAYSKKTVKEVMQIKKRIEKDVSWKS
jgi:CO dehydrogenase nickel-insertion accessory protein CooC1